MVNKCSWCWVEEPGHSSFCQRPEVVFSYEEVPKYWIIKLNKYQRDNLLWLFAAIGYVRPEGHTGSWRGIEPFNLANTGDWVGEVPNMLAEPGKQMGILDKDARPNVSLEQFNEFIKSFLKELIKKEGTNV